MPVDTDTYDFDLDTTDVAQSVARVDIVDNGGTPDHINLDVDSTGFDIYLHPQEVLLNKLDLTFNAGVEELHLTDRAADTTITTKSGSGFSELLIKTGVTITQAEDGDIVLNAKGNFTMQQGSRVETDGDVDIYADVEDVAPDGATITILGTINSPHVTVHGTGKNDAVVVGIVASGSVMTVNAGDGDDTITVGTPAPGIVDGIDGTLNLNGGDGADILNVEDTGDGNANTGTLTPTTITGLDMTGGIITYDSFATAERRPRHRRRHASRSRARTPARPM